MDCDLCREAVSARTDGEPEPVPAKTTDAHLASCTTCRQWQRDMAALTRGLRLRPAIDTPDLTARIIIAAPELVPPVRSTRAWYPRMVLGGVAVAQLTLGLAQVLGVSDAESHAGHVGTSSTHLFNESTAWNLALGLGMLWTALRPKTASGLLPVMAGFLAVLTPFSAHDLITGTAPLTRISSHAFLVLGLLVLLIMHRARHTPEDGTGATATSGTTGSPLTADGGEGEEHRTEGENGAHRRWGHLRPVSRNPAA